MEVEHAEKKMKKKGNGYRIVHVLQRQLKSSKLQPRSAALGKPNESRAFVHNLFH